MINDEHKKERAVYRCRKCLKLLYNKRQRGEHEKECDGKLESTAKERRVITK